MRLLVVAASPILPLSHGGRVRTFRLAAAMARAGATVDLLCPWAPGLPRRAFTREGIRCQPHFFATNVLLTLPDERLPSVVALSWQPFSFGPRRRFRSARSYDVIQFELCAYGAWMSRLARDARVVYSSHNVEADFARGQAADSPFGRALVRRISTLERRAVEASDLVVTCTESDAERLRTLYGGAGSFAVVPNGFEERLLSMDRAAMRAKARSSLALGADERALLFVGGGAGHNRAAARFLAHSVLPRLPSGNRLMLVGKCTAGLQDEEDGAIVRLRYVEDLRPVLAAADVALNPVAYGSGSNLKMAEYLAAGLPIVSTAVGARGFEQFGDAVRVAELADFAAALEDPPSAPSRPAGLDELGWDRLGGRLLETYSELLERPR